MRATPYERTAAVLRMRFRRQPVAATAVALACLWIAVNVYEAAVHWGAPEGWFGEVTTTVTLSDVGVVAIAAITWLVERLFRDA
jgi:hypothetical protein